MADEPIAHCPSHIVQVSSIEKSWICFYMNTNTNDYDSLEGSVSDCTIHT